MPTISVTQNNQTGFICIDVPRSDVARWHTLSSGRLMQGWLFKDRPCARRKHLWWFQPRDINMCLQAPGWWACLWNHERQLVFHLGPPRPYQPHSDQFWQPTNQLSGAISQQPRGSWHTLGGSGSLPEAEVGGYSTCTPAGCVWNWHFQQVDASTINSQSLQTYYVKVQFSSQTSRSVSNRTAPTRLFYPEQINLI